MTEPQNQDHRQRIIEKIKKMQKQAEGEAAIGNIDAAESFAAMVNKMMLEYELDPDDLKYAASSVDDPIIEHWVDLGTHKLRQRGARIPWQEKLASVVAWANLCRILVKRNSNDICFVGTGAHVMVAEYTYGTLAFAANAMSKKALADFRKLNGREACAGFRPSWLDAFVGRIKERLDAQRQTILDQRNSRLPSVSAESGALVRLNNAMIRVEQYMAHRFTRHVKEAGYRRGLTENERARALGRAAADRMNIGQRGLTAERRKIGS